MGRSIRATPTQVSGRFVHRRSESTVVISNEGGRMQHSVSRHGITAKYDIAYEVGAGQVGYSYLVRLGEYIFQSPASYYEQSRSWDVTPGYDDEHILDFDHPILSGCTFCHTGSTRLQKGTTNRFDPVDNALTPISCDRCHGDPAVHLAHPATGNIVNPARLAPAERDSICEQCHLEGEARVLATGKDWSDFRAGQRAEQVFSTFVLRHASTDVPAVSHSEQLAASKCARASGGKIWCGTCHDPHGSKSVTAACRSCHERLFASNRHQPATECTSCHMPRLRATNVAHAAVTDHRIPGTPHPVRDNSHRGTLVTWRGAATSREEALALYADGLKRHDQSELQRAYDLLRRQPPTDPEAQAALAELLIGINAGKFAVGLLAPVAGGSAELHMLLGSALADTGHLKDAVAELETAIRLDPSLAPAYRRLAAIYGKDKNHEQYRRILSEYLIFMPQSIRFRTVD